MSRAEAQRISSLASLGIILAQILLVACALVMGRWVEIPWLGLIALGVCGAASIIATTVAAVEKRSLLRLAFIVTAITGLMAPLSLLLPSRHLQTLDVYHAAIAWLIAAVVFAPALLRRDPVAGKWWKQLATLWGLLGGVIWLSTSYDQNLPGAFYFGLALNILLLVAVKACFKMPFIGVQAVNTSILILLALPLADLAMRLTHRLDLRPDTGKRYYSYEVARKKPAAFATWWKYYNQQWELMARTNFMRDPSGQLPLRLRPNSRGEFFQSHICVNSKGFRGREFSNEKGETYRIVALGESTTFGCTLNADDKPWPEVLEEAIRARLKLSRPVEVINAGVPGYTLVHNLARLNSDILPLKPDMIISYHGYNGLDLLSSSSPRRDAPLPPYRPRPLKLLADAEHGLKIMNYKRHMTAQNNNSQPFADPMQSPYAAAYRQLIEITRSNSITLVIGNFSMAASTQSEPGVLDFYRAGYPLAASRVKANVAHSLMVRQLVKENPETYFVDTHPNLDGEHEKFIDLVHFTQEGRRQLAETFFAGITNILIERLAAPERNRLSRDAH
jgi:lysophospholipase L1-like esterase